MAERYAEWSFHAGQWSAWQSPARVKVVVAGRRWGKDVVGARWALVGARHDAQTRPGGLSWVVCPDYPLSRQLWRTMLEQAPAGWITRTWGTEVQPDTIEVMGTEKIEFKSADRPRSLVGVGLRRLLVNECGIVKEMTWQESLRPTLIDYGAPAWLLGTPKGQNWFYREYAKGADPAVKTHAAFGGPSYENPWVPESEIRALAADYPERLVQQEIMARFLTDEGAVFRGVRRLAGAMSASDTAVLGVDLGKHVDFTVIHGLDADGRTTYWDRFKDLAWTVQEERIRAAWEAGGRPPVYLDSTGVGDAPYDHLTAMGVDVVPVRFTAQVKRQLVESLAVAIETAAVGLPDEPVLLNELEAFEYDITAHGNVRYGAPEGLHDDAVIALALAWRGLQTAAMRPKFRVL